MSPTMVYKLSNLNKTLYLKISHNSFKNTTYDVEREMKVITWLKGKIEVPDIFYFEKGSEYSFLIMSEATGQCLEFQEWKAQDLVKLYAKCIKLVQNVAIENCPFTSNTHFRIEELKYLQSIGRVAMADFEEGVSPFTKVEELIEYLEENKFDEELVFSHGDISDGNIFTSQNQIESFIDWGRGGLADKWYDIALCVRNIQEDLAKDEYVDLLFKELNIEPDWDKINYYIWLDELF